MTYAEVVDARGQVCPMPVITLAQAAGRHSPGDRLLLLSDDAAARHDVPAWCAMRGHELVGETPPPDGGPGTGFDVRLR